MICPPTERQREVLRYLWGEQIEGRTFTVRSLARAFGWASTNAADTQLRALMRHGFIEKQKRDRVGAWGGIRVTEEGARWLGERPARPMTRAEWALLEAVVNGTLRQEPARLPDVLRERGLALDHATHHVPSSEGKTTR